MSAYNATTRTTYPISVFCADSFLTRMAGLLGYRQLGAESLHIIPATNIHTWGMDFPVDLVWLDKQSKITKFDSHTVPGQFVKGAKTSQSVLELPSGFLGKHELKIGDHLLINSQKPQTLYQQ